MRNYCLLFSTLIFVLFFSCTKQEMEPFVGHNLLYFNTSPGESVDSALTVNFAFHDDVVVDSVIMVNVGLMGLQLEKPTSFKVMVDENLSNAKLGIDFEIDNEFQFPAKANFHKISIKLNRTPLLSKEDRYIVLRLAANDELKNDLFKTNVNKTISNYIKIHFKDYLLPPPRWVSTDFERGTDYYFGEFSAKKIRVLHTLYTYWTTEQLYSNVQYYGSYFGDLLNEHIIQQQALGMPVLESDGTLMKLGPYYGY